MNRVTLVDGKRMCRRCGNRYPETKEYFYTSGKHFQSYCKKCDKYRRKINDQNRPDLKARRSARWRNSHEKYQQEYWKRNRFRLLPINKERYYLQRFTARYRYLRRINENKRRARKAKFPCENIDRFIPLAEKYFDSCCPYCGTEFTGGYHIDHYIPISHPNCPGHIPTNVIPVCPKCNLSKHNKLPDMWIRETFNTNADAIIGKIADYFYFVEHISRG